jgi:hypothetical protein
MPDHNQPRELTQNEKDGMELLRRTSISGNAAQQAAPPRPVRDRAELVMEIAMRKRFRERKTKKVERPTIEQLEAMLNTDERAARWQRIDFRGASHFHLRPTKIRTGCAVRGRFRDRGKEVSDI